MTAVRVWGCGEVADACGAGEGSVVLVGGQSLVSTGSRKGLILKNFTGRGVCTGRVNGCMLGNSEGRPWSN